MNCPPTDNVAAKARRSRLQMLVGAVLSLALASAGSAHAQETAARYSFALIGDLPYTQFDETVLTSVLEDIGKQSRIVFTAHVGDIKSGSEPCTDKLLESRKALLDASVQPLVLVPGDNEWTDCHRKAAGGFDPVERLTRLRELFFDDDLTLGQQKMHVSRQAESARFSAYRENVRWELGADVAKVLFVGINVTGSNNNFIRAAGRNGEFEERRAANRDWLARAFTIARQRHAAGLVIVMQGDPLFENDWRNDHGPTLLGALVSGKKRDGYLEFKRQLQQLTETFPGQVLLVHGDTHQYRYDQPLRAANGNVLANFRRVETYGYPFTNHWVEVGVDPSQSTLFVVTPHLVRLAPTDVGQTPAPPQTALE